MVESEIVDGTQEFKLDSWSEFWELTTNLFASAPAFVYRGQANYNWPLRSSLDRLEERFPKRKNLTGKIPEFFDESPPFTEEAAL